MAPGHPKQNPSPPPGAFTPKRRGRSPKLDRVQAAHLNSMEICFACEHCSFFSPPENECLMGMPTTPHRLDQQWALFQTTGHMAFCRFLEID